jgi:hypothetical protein
MNSGRSATEPPRHADHVTWARPRGRARIIVEDEDTIPLVALCISSHRSIVVMISRAPPTLRREDVAEGIAQGKYLFIHRSRVINATAWAPYHPGGALAILHFVGRDATDEVEAYHSVEALQRMEKYVVGLVEIDEEEGWKPLTPPIALGLVRHPDGVKGHWAREGSIRLAEGKGDPLACPNTDSPFGPEINTLSPGDLEPPSSDLDLRKERARSKAYHELKTRITEAGLFNRPGPLSGYGSDILRYTLLGSAAFALYFLCVHDSQTPRLADSAAPRVGSGKWLPLPVSAYSSTSSHVSDRKCG